MTQQQNLTDEDVLHDLSKHFAENGYSRTRTAGGTIRFYEDNEHGDDNVKCCVFKACDYPHRWRFTVPPISETQRFEEYDTAQEAADAAYRWLEEEMARKLPGVHLSDAQRRTFSREWDALFDDLVQRGWRIEWLEGLLHISQGEYRIRAVLKAGKWVLGIGDIRTDTDWNGTDEDARTVIWGWTLALDENLREKAGDER